MSWYQAHVPLLTESFSKTPRKQFEASRFSGSRNYKTKQTTFLHRQNYVTQRPQIQHPIRNGYDPVVNESQFSYGGSTFVMYHFKPSDFHLALFMLLD
jgi:hypothetical protein